MKDLIRLMDPKYMRSLDSSLLGSGISIYPYANYGKPGTRYEAFRSLSFATARSP